MTDEAKPRNWWQTLPGVLTALAALVTALAGLLAAITQTGWFGRQEATTVAPSASGPPTHADAGTPAAPRPQAVALPAQRDYKLGPAVFKATFTLLKAEVVPQTADRSALHVTLRMTNHDRYDKNFWDRSFRLLVGGVPVAPESQLNELVPGDSAKEGTIVFPIARGTPAATLRINYYDDTTDIPLALGP